MNIINRNLPYHYYPFLDKLLAVYFMVVALFIFSCLKLYSVSDNPIRREKGCRYMDLPEVEYPKDFNEEKGRQLPEQRFTYKYLADSSHRTMRVILVPVIALGLLFNLSVVCSLAGNSQVVQ